MGKLWTFLGRDRNRMILGWLGGGLVVVAGGLWALIVHVYPPQKDGGQQQPGVSAGPGGVAIGRDVSGSTINVGPSAPAAPAGR